MEYDFESGCEGCSRDFESSVKSERLTQARDKGDRRNRTSRSSVQTISEETKLKLNPANKSLSSQVMEYYHKYSRNSNLDQYFSLPVSNTPQEAVKYYYSIYELSAKVGSSNRQDCIGEEYNLKSYVPRERRRWVRPPLIGQSSNTDTSPTYVQPLTDLQTPSPDLKPITPEIIHEETSENQDKLPEVADRKLSSPTSSVASYKPLEWDSGADVGYFNLLPYNKQIDKKLSTIERMALARGCSAALRLDPEGTTESGKVTTIQGSSKLLTAPNANSTPLIENASESESEMEITPIVKNHLPGIIAGDDIKSQMTCISNDAVQQKIVAKSKHVIQNFDTSTLSSAFKIPSTKYPTTERKVANKHKENIRRPSSPLKKSISMNTLAASTMKFSLKRSQSELNLHTKEKKTILPLIFNSTSSIATVVNKPATCDKVIQTSMDICNQESIGIQVSDIDESKSQLTEKYTNSQGIIHSILKKSKGTYKVKKSKKCDNSSIVSDVDVDTGRKENQGQQSSSEISQNASSSITPQPDETENVSGRANSFEYFPGHTYANVANEKDSRISSDTGRSNSTLPNSSSSINEKLWGDSDSLVRDLEKSVNILKSLVDANKCDKQVKKRLIQHVIKRLVTAKYTDDKIEHNLEDNVPWNPDDARNKVYRAELLQALAKKRSTTESSDEWNLHKKDSSLQKSAGTTSDVIKEVAVESSTSDKFDRHTDRTELDGRKARLGLRTDDCQQSSNTVTDPDKSESSECFVPQRNHKNNKVNGIFCFKDNCKLPDRESSTTNSIPPDHNRILLDAVVNNRRTPIESNNNTDNNTDWRLPTTSSERHFELKKCSMSESGDSKLVNYAEMEKRNQLIWITNEISHLCNLKKLLEQPRRLERSKSSPRKSKSTNLKSKQGTCISEREQNAGAVHRNTSTLQECSVNEPWSSHCNLATCDTAGDNVIQRIMKRNSCTQTATNRIGAYSKTGGEIVSVSRLPNSGIKYSTIGMQTLHQEMSVASIEPDMYDTKCTNSQNLCTHFQNSSKCKEQSCQKHTTQILQHTYARCNQNMSHIRKSRLQKNVRGEALAQQIQADYTSDNSISLIESVCHRTSQINSVQHKQKETKNQINASKSKCTCGFDACLSTNDNKTGSSVVEAKRIDYYKQALFTICPLCSKQIPVMEVSNIICNCELCKKNPSCIHGNILGDNKTHVCANASNCDNINDAICKPRQNYNAESQNKYILDSNDQNNITKLCDCANECACQNLETITGTLCKCHSNDKSDDNEVHHVERCLKISEHPSQMQVCSPNSSQNSNRIQQHKVQNSLKCSCDEASFYSNNQTKHTSKGKVCRNYISKSSFVNDVSINKTVKNCKHCRTCGALYQTTRKCNCCQVYPKAIAYELSFTKENTSRNKPKDLFVKQSSNAVKSDVCPCDTPKKNTSNKNTHQISTLQDYLSKNNPGFVDNAETRRQYLSEICHLRELRKEKRIRLLAMASTSSIIRPAQTSKPLVCAQKKITDEEMKERLRKRYLRLNEVRFKRRQQERQEEARRNKLMAKIFCKRLQQKVLRGQVDLSQSVSVISNL